MENQTHTNPLTNWPFLKPTENATFNTKNPRSGTGCPRFILEMVSGNFILQFLYFVIPL